MIKITLKCKACDGHGSFGSRDLSSNKTSMCYECYGEGEVVIEDKYVETWWDAMDDYPNAIKIET